MTQVQKRKLLEKIVQIEDDLSKLERARVDAAVSGYASCSLSSSGGARSYTRITIDQITNLINELNRQLSGLRALFFGNGGLKTITTIYS